MANHRGLTDSDRINALEKIVELYSNAYGFPVLVKERATGLFWFEEVRDIDFRMVIDRMIFRLRNKGKL